MQVLHPHCAGLDVHKESAVVACVRHVADADDERRGRARHDEVRTFGTSSRELNRLGDWLVAEGA